MSSISNFLARPKPRGAKVLRFYLANEPHTEWERDAPELQQYKELSIELQKLAEQHSEDTGQQVACKLAWLDARGTELTTTSWNVGFAQGQAQLDGSANATAINAQRYVESIMRAHIEGMKLQQKNYAELQRGWQDLAKSNNDARVGAEGEARALRAELRALRAKEAEGNGEEVEEPSVMETLTKNLPEETVREVAGQVVGAIVGMMTKDKPANGGGGSPGGGDVPSTPTT